MSFAAPFLGYFRTGPHMSLDGFTGSDLPSPAVAPVPAVVMGDTAAHSAAPSRLASHRACIICHKAKTRCDGQRPCARCTRLGRAEKCLEHPNRKRQCFSANRADIFVNNNNKPHNVQQARQLSLTTSPDPVHLRPNLPYLNGNGSNPAYLDASPWSSERANPPARYLMVGGSPCPAKYPGPHATNPAGPVKTEMAGPGWGPGVASNGGAVSELNEDGSSVVTYASSHTKDAQRVTYWSVSGSSSSRLGQPTSTALTTTQSTSQPFVSQEQLKLLSDLLTLPPEIKFKPPSFAIPIPPQLWQNRQILELFQKEYSSVAVVEHAPSTSDHALLCAADADDEPKTPKLRLVQSTSLWMTPEISPQGFDFIRRHISKRVAECQGKRNEVFSSPTPAPAASQSHLPCLILSLDATDDHMHFLYTNEALHLLTGQNHGDLVRGFAKYGIVNMITMFTPECFKDLMYVKNRLRPDTPTVNTFLKVQNKWGSRVPIMLSTNCTWARDRITMTYNLIPLPASNDNASVLAEGERHTTNGFGLDCSPSVHCAPSDSLVKTSIGGGESRFDFPTHRVSTHGMKRALSGEDSRSDYSIDFLRFEGTGQDSNPNLL
eukprot:g9672.t1